uniref:Uncharacterized protein n=1 Tax=Steinernema glaseri TaxID=37863 RepID=A0A1I7XYF7_9BILA
MSPCRIIFIKDDAKGEFPKNRGAEKNHPSIMRSKATRDTVREGREGPKAAPRGRTTVSVPQPPVLQASAKESGTGVTCSKGQTGHESSNVKKRCGYGQKQSEEQCESVEKQSLAFLVISCAMQWDDLEKTSLRGAKTHGAGQVSRSKAQYGVFLLELLRRRRLHGTEEAKLMATVALLLIQIPSAPQFFQPPLIAISLFRNVKNELVFFSPGPRPKQSAHLIIAPSAPPAVLIRQIQDNMAPHSDPSAPRAPIFRTLRRRKGPPVVAGPGFGKSVSADGVFSSRVPSAQDGRSSAERIINYEPITVCIAVA